MRGSHGRRQDHVNIAHRGVLILFGAPLWPDAGEMPGSESGVSGRRRGRPDQEEPRPIPTWIFFALLWLAVTLSGVGLYLVEG